MICPRSLLLCPGYFWGSFQVSGNHMRALDNHWFAYMDRQAARALDFQEEGGDLEGKKHETYAEWGDTEGVAWMDWSPRIRSLLGGLGEGGITSSVLGHMETSRNGSKNGIPELLFLHKGCSKSRNTVKLSFLLV